MSDSDRDENSVTAVTMAEGDTASSVDATVNEPSPSPEVKRRGGFIAWLALLLVVGLGGGVAWLVDQAMQRSAVLSERLAALETADSTERDSIESSLAALEARLEQAGAARSTEFQDEVSAQAARLRQVEEGLAEQRSELTRFTAADRESWLLAEAEYLLRLANQRLLMTGDTQAAAALLASADAVIKQMEDPALLSVRAALATDIAAVRAVPQLDIEGLYVRLGALINQADSLAIFELPELDAPPPPEPADDWQSRLAQGYQAALAKLSDYIIIRRRDVPMQALMDPQWEGMVRQNLRMLLEQAQVALLSGNQFLFTESLGRAQEWVAQFFESDEAAARALSNDIARMRQETVQVDLPDVSGSLRELQAAISRHNAAKGAP